MNSKVSLYKHPKNGVLAVVSNLSKKEANLISHRISFNEALKMYQKLLQDRSFVMGVVLLW